MSVILIFPVSLELRVGPLVAGHHGVPHVVPPLTQAENVVLPAGSHDVAASVASMFLLQSCQVKIFEIAK